MTQKKARLMIDRLPIPLRYEVLHFLVSGSTGSGKSELLARLLLALQLRRDCGDRAFVVDPGVSLAQKFLLPSDCDLNPLDRRAPGWSPLAEMRSPTDATRMAKSIVPEPAAPADRSWYGYGRELLSAALTAVWEHGGDNGELNDLLILSERIGDLRTACEGTPASVLFLPENEKMRANSMGVLSPYLRAFTYLPRRAGSQSFSIRKWVEGRYPRFRKGWLWWPVPTDQLEALAPLIATQIAAFTTAALQLPEDGGSRRIFLVADEFSALGKVPSIETVLTLGRKRGLAAILAIHSIAELRHAYGRDGAEVLLSCLSNWIIMRSTSADTAELMSKHIGDREIEITEESQGESGNYWDGRSQRSRSITRSIHRRVERAFLASEIQHLPTLRAIVTLADRSEVVPITVPLVTPFLPHVAPGFVTRPSKESPQPEGDTPAPAAPVSGGPRACSPTSRTSSANFTSTAAAAKLPSPPSAYGIALDDFIAHDPTAPQAQPSRSSHGANEIRHNADRDDSATS